MSRATLPVRLGFAVGTGEPVDIPILNMAVTGMTQDSGKTTALEAIVTRAGVTAIAFVTKRGETNFADAPRVQPYFRDRADWQFVVALLDAVMREKNKWLRPWIIRICRTTKTLADVQARVREEMETAKGVNLGAFTQIDAYLELIVPELERLRLPSSLQLSLDALNVMDLGAMSRPLQMLFIQSAIDWINEHENGTIVIVPEAWEFIPEGKGSPVKASAEDLVRKGSVLGNQIFVDSQDMAGVDKMILRGCPVWLIGVQREANEIKRALSNIPASIKKPTAAQIAGLERGEFFACWKGNTIKTYVWPAWLKEGDAISISVSAGVNRENILADVEELRTRAAINTRTAEAFVERGMAAQRAVNARLATIPRIHTEADVKESEALALRQENERLMNRVEQLEAQLGAGNGRAVQSQRLDEELGERSRGTPLPVSAVNTDDLYLAIKKRLLDELPKEPRLLKLLTTKPAIDVAVEIKTVTIDGESWVGRTAQLLAEGFFDEPVKTGVVFKEAARRGARGIPARADEAVKKLFDMGFLTRESDGFQAVPGMKVNIIKGGPGR